MTGQGKEDGKDARAARLAEALRENLHRRKAQARQRKAADIEQDEKPQETSDDA